MMLALPQPGINLTRSEIPFTMPYARQNRKTGMISYKEQKERRYSPQCDTPNRGELTPPRTSHMEANMHRPLRRKLSCSAHPSSPNHQPQTYREKTNIPPAGYRGLDLPTKRYETQSYPRHQPRHRDPMY